jgi:hypothetical protein
VLIGFALQAGPSGERTLDRRDPEPNRIGANPRSSMQLTTKERFGRRLGPVLAEARSS